MNTKINNNYITYMGQLAILNNLYNSKNITEKENTIMRRFLQQKYQIRD